MNGMLTALAMQVFRGDCRDVLKTLPSESVHCVVTSPPYWGLRDYGTATWEGGDSGCDHRLDARKPADWSTSGLQRNKKTPELSAGTVALVNHQQEPHYRNECHKCGARRIDSQIGLEPDFNAYIAGMVAVFREVRRVLRSDGTCWINLGDSYATGTSSGRTPAQAGKHGYWENPAISHRINGAGNGLKPKDLCGIPWRVAFALQADGWWLRQDIIWSKPNPMPESVTDRCTKAHEYLFLMSKSARYYYDAQAIKEQANQSTIERNVYKRTGNAKEQIRGDLVNYLNPQTTEYWNGNIRNKRSVWEVATAPFSEAHFATFPPALIEPCIKAGTSEKGCCAKCGATRVRQVERTQYEPQLAKNGERFVDASRGDKTRKLSGSDYNKSVMVVGESWSPSCSCNAEAIPCTVLDPFGGAGTTGLVADRLQRNAILIELNPEYAAMASRRIRDDAPLFAEAAE